MNASCLLAAMILNLVGPALVDKVPTLTIVTPEDGGRVSAGKCKVVFECTESGPLSVALLGQTKGGEAVELASTKTFTYSALTGRYTSQLDVAPRPDIVSYEVKVVVYNTEHGEIERTRAIAVR